jgi:hypothetical protein
MEEVVIENEEVVVITEKKAIVKKEVVAVADSNNSKREKRKKVSLLFFFVKQYTDQKGTRNFLYMTFFQIYIFGYTVFKSLFYFLLLFSCLYIFRVSKK